MYLDTLIVINILNFLTLRTIIVVNIIFFPMSSDDLFILYGRFINNERVAQPIY